MLRIWLLGAIVAAVVRVVVLFVLIRQLGKAGQALHTLIVEIFFASGNYAAGFEDVLFLRLFAVAAHFPFILNLELVIRNAAGLVHAARALSTMTGEAAVITLEAAQAVNAKLIDESVLLK